MISTEPIYRIQIAALNSETNKSIQNDKSIAKIGALNILQVNSVYKFQIGDFPNIDMAREAKDKLVALGYKSAFLTQVSQ